MIVIPRWHVLAARTALALRKHASTRFPPDMANACHVGSILLAMVYRHHRIKCHLADAWFERRGIGHVWVEVDGRMVDLTATQLGFSEIVRVSTKRPRNSRVFPVRVVQKAIRKRRPQDMYSFEVRRNYPVLVPALADVLAIPRSEARRRLRDFLGPEVRR